MKNKSGKDSGVNILGLDTSSRLLTVACSDKVGRTAESNFQGVLQHSENFFRLMESVLDAHKLSFNQIDAFAIGMGPGSFTGLRIGFSVIKGLLTAHPRPVYGISSLDLIAEGISLDSGRLAVAVNARRERIYTAFYRFSQGQWERETPEDEVLSPEELAAALAGGLDRPGHDKTYLAGDALKEYGDLLRKKMPKAVFIQENFWYPRASRLVHRVQSRYTQMKPLDAGGLQPKYLRLSEAEEKNRGNIFAPGRLS